MDWGVLWISKGGLDGDDQHLVRNSDCLPVLFKTRREAKAWIDENYGYIKTRKDLRAYPHGWRLPIPVKVHLGYTL